MKEINIILWNIAMTPNPPPKVSTRDAKHRAPFIAEVIKNYDIIVLNESFLYRDYLLSFIPRDTYPYRYTEPKIWYKVFNSGVVIISKIRLFNLNYKHYTKVAIWDWFVSKALVGCSFSLNEDVTVDLYGTHLQAGNQTCAQNARAQQTKEIVQQVKSTHTPNHELIICGDFNCGPVYDKTYKTYSVHYASEEDARQRAAQYSTMVDGLELTPILTNPKEDDISSYLYKGYWPRVDVVRTQSPDIVDDKGVSLSDTGPLCLRISI